MGQGRAELFLMQIVSLITLVYVCPFCVLSSESVLLFDNNTKLHWFDLFTEIAKLCTWITTWLSLPHDSRGQYPPHAQLWSLKHQPRCPPVCNIVFQTFTLFESVLCICLITWSYQHISIQHNQLVRWSYSTDYLSLSACCLDDTSSDPCHHIW